MRLAGINSFRGSVTVLFVAALPLMIAALIVIVEVGRIAVARARLQSAADRAAYAGAASLADSMNVLASSNWHINKAYRDLEKEFVSSNEQNEQAVNQRIESYEAARDSALGEMGDVLENMHDRSEAAATNVLGANYPSASATLALSGDIEISEDMDQDQQWGELGYSYVTGDIFIDPEDVSGGTYEALRYMAKARGSDAIIGVHATAAVEPLTTASWIGDGIDIYASAAASAFGGSIEEFAQKETDDLDVAEGWVDEDEYDALYRASLVPLWTAGVDEHNN